MKAIYIFLFAVLAAGAARAEQVVVLVANSVAMPMADIRDGKLRAGIHLDLGKALAQKLRRELVIEVMPRKRLAQTLESGRADILCTYQPDWLEGRHIWTQPFFPQSDLLVTTSSAPRPHAIADVRDRPVGTVLGFAYPEMDRALGAGFVRSDAQSQVANLDKFRLGRVQHMIIDKAFYDYQVRLGLKAGAHPPLVVKYQLTRCAVSARSKVPLAEIETAINQLVREGAITKILSNYQ
ncbi:substrate-binding periplasmic protein [Pseudoduganella sp. OTU4001]|uniref:substrate-binding periplasmic protein n=1 Tax=Pseudoduganella sp. OTU4001 TaxID=3043854 RepID=UPI00313B88AF